MNMFTGLIKEVGKVVALSKTANLYNLKVASGVVSKNAALGDSVTVNGVCLTVTKNKSGILYFDCVEETMRKTNLGELRSGDTVNLEDSLKANDPIGGHFVLGHVDCVGKIIGITRHNKDISMEISIPKESGALIVEKGSITLDGVSLTIGSVTEDSFKVYLIPYTLESTNLSSKVVKSVLNVEFDIIGKYILRQRKLSDKKGLTDDYLKEKGFS